MKPSLTSLNSRLFSALAHAADKAKPEYPRSPVVKPSRQTDIYGGRQLIVDDWLISEATLKPTYHQATVLKTETKLKPLRGTAEVAVVFDGGVCFDAKDRLFKMGRAARCRDGIATGGPGLSGPTDEQLTDIVKHSPHLMTLASRIIPLAFLFVIVAAAGAEPTNDLPRRTEVSIKGEAFHINGEPTYKGRSWKGHSIEGLLLNARMVQATFDDLNPSTRERWAYPDTKQWDAERNTREFIAALPEYRRCGLLAFTLNLQGGSPEGYSKTQPWHNSAFEADGSLRADYLARLDRVLDRADELGMVVILGLFYFGQDERLRDEAAVTAGVNNALNWLAEKRWRNVLIEINNECDTQYDHAILQAGRVHELISLAREHPGHFLVGTSFKGKSIPTKDVVRVSDFLLLHGNGARQPEQIARLVSAARQVPGYRPMPVLINEDDHFDFDTEPNNFTTAICEHVSWGYFDFRKRGEGHDEGYQCPPVNWGISSERKRGFFKLLSDISGDSPK